MVSPSAERLGARTISRLEPRVPTYATLIVSVRVRSRWTSTFQIWTHGTRKFGSTAKLLVATPVDVRRAVLNGAGSWSVASTVFVVLNGGCSASCCTMAGYALVL